MIDFYSKARTCHKCLKNNPKTHRCKECKAVQYCSHICQKEDHKLHQKLCNTWKSEGKIILGPKEQKEKLRTMAYRMEFMPTIQYNMERDGSITTFPPILINHENVGVSNPDTGKQDIARKERNGKSSEYTNEKNFKMVGNMEEELKIRDNKTSIQESVITSEHIRYNMEEEILPEVD